MCAPVVPATVASGHFEIVTKYLFQGSYTAEGTRGLLKEGGTSRRDTIEQLMKGMGGTLESLYYAFGPDDVVGIVDLPDSVTGTAVSLAVNAAGAVRLRITPLITPEEVDQAAKMSIGYRPPGQ